MPPRRSHRKSRAGCRRCKSRKIKCDEVHPRCGNCVRHGVPCDFQHPEVAEEVLSVISPSPANTPAAAPNPQTPSDAPAYAPPLDPLLNPSGAVRIATPLATWRTPLYKPPVTPALCPTTPASARLLELKLMHHYTTQTCKTFTFQEPVTEELWKITVPQLAFSGAQHLTDAVLAVAALHLRSLCPNDKELVRASHAYMAASLAEYSAALTKGINADNAEALFLTSALIANQSTATRTFMKDELSYGSGADRSANSNRNERSASSGGYSMPLPWFHAFQGIKAITAASWQYIRHSPVLTQIINSQPVLQLDFGRGSESFFGHLLEGLDEEIAALQAGPESPPSLGSSSGTAWLAQTHTANLAASAAGPAFDSPSKADDTRHAYQHAVAVLNWAHKIPHKGAALAFPATVSRRFVELLEERQPRALAILACFMALLRSLDGVWWLHGMSRREVPGILSLLHESSGGGRGLGADVYHRWWPHLEWAMRIAAWPDSNGPIPPDVWGADCFAEERDLAEGISGNASYVNHIEMISQMVSPVQSLPPVPISRG